MNRITERKYTGKLMKNLGKMGLLLLASILMMPGQVFAQGFNCPAYAELNFVPENNNGPFELGQVIPIEMTIAMPYTGGATPTVNIDHFQYFLDCEPGLGLPFPGCTAQGNGVTFVGPVTTTCTDDNNVTPAKLVTDQTGVIVDFYAVDNLGDNPPPATAAIELQSPATNVPPATCAVNFGVQIDTLAEPDSTDPLYEYALWTTADAICDNGASSDTLANLTVPIVNPNAVFWVTKDFTDDNELPVDVHLRCNTGINRVQDFTITDPSAGGIFDKVGFIVYGIPSIGANCRVFEGPVPEGYKDKYAADFTEGAIFDDLYAQNGEGCFYEGVQSGEDFCDITNKAEPATFTVYKEWVIVGDGGDEVEEWVDVTITCDSEILEIIDDKPDDKADADSVSGRQAAVSDKVSSVKFKNNYKAYGVLGDGDSLSVSVDTKKGPATCRAKEDVQESGVESMDDCGNRTIPAGGSSECTFVNTVFFEGIPTLNQYGMALLALLMIGLGAVSLRRFI